MMESLNLCGSRENLGCFGIDGATVIGVMHEFILTDCKA